MNLPTNLPHWLQKDANQAMVLLAGFALVGVVTLAIADAFTHERIVENERQALLQRFDTLIDHSRYNNNILQDQVTLPAAELGSAEPVTIYRARQDNQPVGALFVVTAPDGYSGKIQLVVGVDAQQAITGVRVLRHKETPGLGDKIETEKGDWILGFNQKSLTNPNLENWKVRKDGGEFDQFTGATITPRAIVGSVKRVLVWSQTHFTELFQMPSSKVKP